MAKKNQDTKPAQDQGLAQDQLLMQVMVSLAQLARAHKSAVDRMVAGLGLSQATAGPLVMIGRLGEEGARPSAVADMLGLEPSSIVRTIEQLIECGLVERRDDSHDRRAKILRLTQEGRRRFVRIEEALIPFRRQLLQDASQADIEACLRVFETLRASLDRLHESDAA